MAFGCIAWGFILFDFSEVLLNFGQKYTEPLADAELVMEIGSPVYAWLSSLLWLPSVIHSS